MGKKSEIIYCLQKIDFYGLPEVWEMGGEGGKIYDYCVKQGAKNNLGMFRQHRGAISSHLRVDSDLCHDFFLKHPTWLGFCPETHLIWVKKLYRYVDFGITKPIKKLKKCKVKDGKKNFTEFREVLDWGAINCKNNFVKKIKSAVRESEVIKNHSFLKDYISDYRPLLEEINEDLKSVRNNNRDLDEFLELLTMYKK